VKIIKFKIQETMNEASSNSLHLAAIAAFCALPWALLNY